MARDALIVARINDRQFLRQMKRRQDQVPFATSLALNNTTKRAQQAERDHLGRVLTLRRAAFVKRGIKVARGDFSTKKNLRTRIHVAEETDFLVKFEEGKTKRPISGRFLAVPIAVKRTKAGAVPQRLYPSRLEQSGIETFVTNVGIFGVQGRGKNARVRLLYAFKEQVPTPRVLAFHATIERTVLQVFEPEFRKAWDRAMATAR